MNFTCINCGREVAGETTGTKHRNHCPYCLWSLHLDKDIPGDRRANCGGSMEPIGLAFKAEGKQKQGELCIVNSCTTCGAISKNRLAADDDTDTILSVFKDSQDGSKHVVDYLLDQSNEREIITQLFGRPYADKYFASPR